MKSSGLFRPFSWFISNAHETREVGGGQGLPPDMLHMEFEGGGARPGAKLAPSSMAREGIGGSNLAASILPWFHQIVRATKLLLPVQSLAMPHGATLLAIPAPGDHECAGWLPGWKEMMRVTEHYGD